MMVDEIHVERHSPPLSPKVVYLHKSLLEEWGCLEMLENRWELGDVEGSS